MTPIDRNPDIDLDKEEIPTGMQLIEGKCLMHTARNRKIPFGVASRINRLTHASRGQTIGLIIRDEHVKEINEAIALKLSKKKP